MNSKSPAATPLILHPSTQRLMAIAIAVGTGIVAPLIMALKISEERMLFADFTVFWTATRVGELYDAAILTAAQNWIVPVDEGLRPFVYPPTSLPLFELLLSGSYYPALVVWTAFGLGAYTIANSVVLGGRVAGLALFAPIAGMTVIVGQISLIASSLVVAGLGSLRERPALAGILLGLLATLKPQLVILAPIALIAGAHWRALAFAFGTGATLGLVSLAVQGQQLWFDWLAALPQFTAIVAEFEGMIVSPGAIVKAIGLQGPAATAWYAASALLGVLAVWRTYRNSLDPVLRLIALLTGSALCAPYAMIYDLVALAPAGAAMLLDPASRLRGLLLGLLAFTVLLGPLVPPIFALWLTLRRQGVSGSPGQAATTRQLGAGERLRSPL